MSALQKEMLYNKYKNKCRLLGRKVGYSLDSFLKLPEGVIKYLIIE